jgi:hypothetical protein
VGGRGRREVIGEKCDMWGGARPRLRLVASMTRRSGAAEAVGGAENVLGGPWIRSNCLT